MKGVRVISCEAALSLYYICMYVILNHDMVIATLLLVAVWYSYTVCSGQPSCSLLSIFPQDLIKSLALLESVFMSSYPNREGTLPIPKPGSSGLHGASLQAWSLLITLCPASQLVVLLDQ